MTDRERRLVAARTRTSAACEMMDMVAELGALWSIRPDLQVKVERLRGSLRWLAKELRRELERGDTTGTTGV